MPHLRVHIAGGINCFDGLTEKLADCFRIRCTSTRTASSIVQGGELDLVLRMSIVITAQLEKSPRTSDLIQAVSRRTHPEALGQSAQVPSQADARRRGGQPC